MYLEIEMPIDFIQLMISLAVGFHFLVVATIDPTSLFGEAAMRV